MPLIIIILTLVISTIKGHHMFNKVKSQLKVIEAGFHKKALIAQNFGPYQIDCINAIDTRW